MSPLYENEANIAIVYAQVLFQSKTGLCLPLALYSISYDDIMKMHEFLVDNICIVFAEKVFQLVVGIQMGTNCAPLLADIFFYSDEAVFIQSLL